MTDREEVLDAVAASLRSVNSIRDFIAACEVGSKVAGDMLNDIETKLLAVLATVSAGE
jgi:hypothetical protein